MTTDRKPCLFLSHSGADTAAAQRLRDMILGHPQAKAAGLKVWFDKIDLVPGRGWQEQIEAALAKEATAFAVYVGSNGIVNWVEREVRMALSLATGPDAIPFLPVLAPDAPKPDYLPPFVQQHHAVLDPLNDPHQFDRLISAVLGGQAEDIPRVEEPFVGLRAMTERESGLFFGRSDEVKELARSLRRHRLLAIVADSGAGKSSLAMAGLVPAFKGGVLADEARRDPSDTVWHTLVMRPGGDPIEGLRRAVTSAAEQLGLKGDQRASLRARIDLANPAETAYALRCDLDTATTETLLIVDQFDELLTETPEDKRQPFIDLLTGLADLPSPGGFYVVLTVRVDYFNLCRPFETLYKQLAAEQDPAVLRLKRISDEGLELAVKTPLRLAGFADGEEAEKLATATRRDLGDRPGDLALAQMALYAVWKARARHGGSLLKAYVDAGGVSGALAQEAERVRTGLLSPQEQELLLPLFVRLIRLGDTGGALRRIAHRNEFDAARHALADRLCRDDHGRLLLAGEDTYEVCHEALITQWPWLQNALNRLAPDLRVLDRLEDKAHAWDTATDRHKFLATGNDLDQFSQVERDRPGWLSASEHAFVADSRKAHERQRRFQQMVRWGAVAAAVVLAAITSVAVWQWQLAVDARHEAEVQATIAGRQTELAENRLHEVEAQRAEAERQRAEAERQADIAAQQKKLAEDRQRDAETQKAEAERQADIAAQQKKLAEDRQKDAETQKAEAERQADIAAQQKKLAEARQKEAEAQKAEAETQRAEADRQRVRAETVVAAATATANSLIFDLADKLFYVRGVPLTVIRDILGKAQELQTQLAAAGEQSPDLQRQSAATMMFVVNTLLALGDTEGALDAADKGLAIMTQLAASDPSNTFWQRELAVSNEKVGDVLMAKGDLAKAAQSYQEEMAIMDRLLAGNPSNTFWQRTIAVAYNKNGDTLKALGNLGAAFESYAKSLDIAAKLSASDPSNTEWLRDRAISYERIGDVKMAQGDLAAAMQNYRERQAIFETLTASDPSNAQWQRDQAISYERMGDVKIAQGDLVAAMDSYRKRLAIFETLSASDASNTEWQRDLSVSYEKIGNVQMAQGDLTAALASYRNELAIQQKLVASDPSNAFWQGTIAVSYEKIGDVLNPLGDLATALENYRKSFDIRDRLVASDPSNTQWRRDLTVSLEKVGDIQMVQGDLAAALESYRRSLTIRDELSASDPSNALWLRDRAISYERIGDVQVAQDDLPAAMESYRKRYDIFDKLAASDPVSTDWQRELSVSEEKVGNVQRAQGDLDAALASYRKALEIRDRLSASDPSNVLWLRDRSIGFEKVGDVLMDQKNFTAALESFRESLVVRDKLSASDPSNTDWQRDQTVSLEKIGDALDALGDHAGALGSFRKCFAIRQKLVASDPSNAQWLRDLMVGHWRLASAGDAPRQNYGEALDILLRLKSQGKLAPSDEQYIGTVQNIIANLPQQ